MSNAAALRPEGGKQSGETSAQRRRERPNPGRLPAGCRRFCAGRGRNTVPVAQKGRRPPPKKSPKDPGNRPAPGKNALRQRARLWQGRLPRTKSRLPSPGPDGLKRHPISFDHPRRNGRTNAPKRKMMKHFSFSFGKKEKNSFGKPPVSVYFIQHIC